MKFQLKILLLTIIFLSGFTPPIQDPEAGGNLYLPIVLNDAREKQRINVPGFQDDVVLSRAAIFWFGMVRPTENYADVRVGYNPQELVISIQVFDRRLWYDQSPTSDTLMNWDAVSLYLDPDGTFQTTPDDGAFKLVSQLSDLGNRQLWQSAYLQQAGDWVQEELVFTTTTGWRGFGLNSNQDGRGWSIIFRIPFTSLGLAGAPTEGVQWGIAITLHDRDDLAGTEIPDQNWPSDLNPLRKETWNILNFGLPTFTPPVAEEAGNTYIRHKLDGNLVADAHIGGAMNCGQPFSPNFFNGWGNAAYPGSQEINIQNQLDVADWPCFSKYYLTFPLDSIPRDMKLISATLRLHQFGNSGQGLTPPPQQSLIQVSTIQDSWAEQSITWNNAPQALENVSQAFVNPLSSFPGWPGIAVDWDLSRAVSTAVQTGKPLRLVLYSADGAYHSGKYFVSSDTEDWNQVGRPTLIVIWGN